MARKSKNREPTNSLGHMSSSAFIDALSIEYDTIILCFLCEHWPRLNELPHGKSLFDTKCN